MNDRVDTQNQKAKARVLSPRLSLPPPPPPPPPPHLQPHPGPSLTRHRTIAGSPSPHLNLYPPSLPSLPSLRPDPTSLSQDPPMPPSVARPPSMLYIPPGAILAVPADNPNAAPIPMIPYTPHSPHFVYYQPLQRAVTTHRYSSPAPPPPPPRPPLPPHLQRASSQPARYTSPPTSSTLSVPPRPPKPTQLISPNSQSTSSTPISSASSHGAYTSSPAEDNPTQHESHLGNFDEEETSDTAEEESAPYTKNDVIDQRSRSQSPEQASPSDAQEVPPGSTTWEPPPPAYEESIAHEDESDEEESTPGAVATGIEATFGRPSSPRANVQEIFLISSPPSVMPAEPLAPNPPVEIVEQVATIQSDYESAGCACNVGDTSQPSVNGDGTFTSSDQLDKFSQFSQTQDHTAPPPPISPRARPARPTRPPPLVPPAAFEMPPIQTSPTTRFHLPPSRSRPSPPSPVSSRPPSPVIFSPAALGYDPTTDTRIDPFEDVPSTPPQTTFPIVRDVSVSKRVPSSSDTTSLAEGHSLPVTRRRRMFSSASGRERLSSLLMSSSSSTHHDKRPQSTAAGPSYHVDLLGPGGIILEHEWTEQGGLPQTNGPDGKKRRHPPTPPEDLEVQDEVSIALGGGEMLDLWHGVEFGYRSPSWDTAPGLLRMKCPPSDFPGRDTPLTLYPSPSIPFFIRAPNWRALLRLLANLNETRIEPTPEALAEIRRGVATLRLVVQFVRTPFLPPVGKAKVEHREVALYLCIHRGVPSIGNRIGKSLRADDRMKWSSWDTSVLPYGFKAAAGSRLAKDTTSGAWMSGPKSVAEAGTPVCEQDPNGDGSLFVTLPPPFIELPATLNELALYLQNSLVLSRRPGKRSRAMTDPKRQSEDSGRTRNVLEKASKSTTNLAVPPPSRPLSMYSASSASRPSTSHSRMDSPSGTHLSPMSELDVERGRGFIGHEQRDPSFSTQVFTPQVSSPPSPVTPNPPPSPPPQIKPSQIPGIKRLAYAIKSFYPDEDPLGSYHLSTGEGTSKPPKNFFFGRMKSKTSHTSGPSKPPIGRGRERDPNLDTFGLISPWRAPAL